MNSIIEIDELNKNMLAYHKYIGHGIRGVIYQISPTECVKIFRSYERIFINDHQYQIIDALSNTPTYLDYAKPTIFYQNKVCLLGYKMPYINAPTLKNLPASTPLPSLVSSLESIKPTIKYFSKNHFDFADTHDKNLLFSNNLYLIDLDNSIILYDSPALLYSKNMLKIYNVLLFSLAKNITINDDKYNHILKELKSHTSDDYALALQSLIDLTENYIDKPLNTVGELRRALKPKYMLKYI